MEWKVRHGVGEKNMQWFPWDIFRNLFVYIAGTYEEISDALCSHEVHVTNKKRSIFIFILLKDIRHAEFNKYNLSNRPTVWLIIKSWKTDQMSTIKQQFYGTVRSTIHHRETCRFSVVLTALAVGMEWFFDWNPCHGAWHECFLSSLLLSAEPVVRNLIPLHQSSVGSSHRDVTVN